MKTRLQSKVAKSFLTLPTTGVYAIIVWSLAGLFVHQWWWQLACMAVSTYLFVELNNVNALLRIRSRMMSSIYLVLSSMVCSLFESLQGAITSILFLLSLLILFSAYQDSKAMRKAYYAFLFIGLASLLQVRILLYVPLLWLLCITQLQFFNWRTWTAALIGLLTPYWFILPWIIHQQQFQLPYEHFKTLWEWKFPIDYSILTIGQSASVIFILIITSVSAFHFWSKSFEDKIRIRQIYGFFAWIIIFTFILLAIQPQHFDTLMRLIIICASPFVAHFFTLTNSRFSNFFFIITCIMTVLVTIINLYSSPLSLISDGTGVLWNGL